MRLRFKTEKLLEIFTRELVYKDKTKQLVETVKTFEENTQK